MQGIVKELPLRKTDFTSPRPAAKVLSGCSISCNCMTRTSQQECRGILEYKNKKSDEEKGEKLWQRIDMN